MKPVMSQPLRLSDLPQRRGTPVRLAPDSGQLDALADRLNVETLRKVLLQGELAPGPGRDWTLTAHLGATVVQPCRVTTEPVTTRIEEDVVRRYTRDLPEPAGDEFEMPEDDSVEAMPAVLDLGDVLEEALALNIPAFPRAPGAEDLDLTARPPGAAPIEEEDTVKPFAGLAALKAKMEGDGSD